MHSILCAISQNEGSQHPPGQDSKDRKHTHRSCARLINPIVFRKKGFYFEGLISDGFAPPPAELDAACPSSDGAAVVVRLPLLWARYSAGREAARRQVLLLPWDQRRQRALQLEPAWR